MSPARGGGLESVYEKKIEELRRKASRSRAPVCVTMSIYLDRSQLPNGGGIGEARRRVTLSTPKNT